MEGKWNTPLLNQLEKLVSIDSPTGWYEEIQEYLVGELKKLGFQPYTLRRGGVICQLCQGGNDLMLLAHCDTLGAVVGKIKSDGRLSISNLTLNSNNTETETVRVYTRNHGCLEGTLQLSNASVHVNRDASDAKRELEKNMEIVLDEDTHTAEETKKLGVMPGDFIALEPRFRVTEKGYIKSRFLDDKASAAVLLELARLISEGEAAPKRGVWVNFTFFEEMGYGAATGIPDEIQDILAVDMGCVGEGLSCTEKMVSICPKDRGGAYHVQMTSEMIETAKESSISYAVDVYPYYSSDATAAIRAGYDVRHALIGPGVYASHGYERTHVEGLENTLALIRAYLGRK